MEERKAQLRKLATLENPKADEYLASFARELHDEIKESNDNDYVAQRLDLLGEFVFRVPEQGLEVIRFVISREPLEPRVVTSRFGEVEGKTHTDLLLKVIELLDYLRYIIPDDVLILTKQLSLWEEKEVRDKALKVVEEYSNYDIRVLPKIGYSAQRQIADFVIAWSMEDKILYIDFIEVVARELLSSSIGSSEMTSMDTVTIRYGQVNPSEYLKKIRKDILNMVNELYKSTSDKKVKLRLVELLDKVTQPPHNVEMTPELIAMMKRDSEYLIDIYRDMISEVIPSVISHIEHRLHWINRSERFKTDKSEELRQEILRDEFYCMFKLLVGDHTDYQEEGGWREAERKSREQMKALIDSIDKSNIGEWIDKLDRIADQRDLVESWRFTNFEYFLIELTRIKPEIADLIFNDAFTKNLPLSYFISAFLLGLRTINLFELWDKYTDKIILSQDSDHLRALVYSLSLAKEIDLEKAIREKDIRLLETIVSQEDSLSFLKGINDSLFHYTLVDTILRNHKRAGLKMDKLIVSEFDRNPEYLETFLQQLDLAIERDWVSVNELQPEMVKFLADRLVEISNLNWEKQGLLLYIGRCEGTSAILDVFMKRIRMDEESRKEKMVLDERYEAIPFQLDPRLQEFISQDKEYQRIMSEWIADMTPKWSLYNWHLSHFLQIIGYGFTEILMSLIEKGDDSSLKKAAIAIHSIEGSHLSLSIEIARRTDNEEILSIVSTNMYSTGVVSGEYGFAITYEIKAKELEKFKNDSSDRVRNFVTRMIKSFNQAAIRERQRADEEIQLRRIEFEG